MSTKSEKQLRKELNAAQNEARRLRNQLIKEENIRNQPHPSGLTKGQRRRRNKQAQSSPYFGVMPSSSIPVPISGTARISAPSAGKTQNVMHRERVAQIFGSSDYTVQGFNLNPGQQPTFPWLSDIARKYEKYEFKSVAFEFIPTVSGYSTTGQQGRIVLSFDFDASDNLPGSMIAAEDTSPMCPGMPFERIRLGIPVRQLSRQDSMYVRPGLLPAGSDIKTYDGGRLAVSIQGTTNANLIGELWVDYSVNLIVPVQETDSAAPQLYQTATLDGYMDAAAGVASRILWSPDVNPWGIPPGQEETVPLPSGNYLIQVVARVSTGADPLQEVSLSLLGESQTSVFTFDEAAGVSVCTIQATTLIQAAGLTAFQALLGSTVNATVSARAYLRLVN